MPIITITLQAGRSADEIRAIMDAVHSATVTAFDVPDTSRNQRLIEIAPDQYFYPDGRSSDFMTIDIASFPGRSDAAKALLYQQITENLNLTAAIDAKDVMILIQEPAFENWGINGQPATRFKKG
jgi:phenylpyruvate tautomerase PptA (4-oxalocrotonate tautomerase family)